MKRNLYYNISISVIFFLLTLFTITNSTIQAQAQTDFLVGSFIVNSDDPGHTLFYNYDQILDCGLNSVFQYAKKTDTTNLNQLAQFKFIYAANDTGEAFNEGNKDWINYFTHAKYYRWEAEGDEYFPVIPTNTNDNITVGVRHEFGDSVQGGWSSGTGVSNVNKFLVYGPRYTQYKKYIYKNKMQIFVPIQYNAKFRLKLGSAQTGSFDVAKIMVTVIDENTGQESTLLDSVLKSTDLSTNYTEWLLSYNYSNYPSENLDTLNTDLPPGSGWMPFGDPKANPYIDFSKKVQFKVQWLANVEVIVDYVEVYDMDIWEGYFKENYNLLVTKIFNYNQEFATANPTFYSKLKYYYTMDEPHTWDSFIPIRKIQHILDSLQTGKEFLVHFYPEWNNVRENVSVMDKWMGIANPKKLMFWYAPFTRNTQ